MPKINQEEYEVLKGLDDKWEWIARNYNGALITYTDKPTKNPNLYWDSFGERMEDRLFQFIQWEDEEPYNIAELIEEYEEHEFVKINQDGRERLDKLFGKESEETEVKDMKWFKKKLDDIEVNTTSLQNHDAIWMLNRVHELYDQLDEPETLSEKWLDENKSSWTKLKIDGYYIPVEKLQTLLVPTLSEMETVEITEEHVVEWLNNNDFYDHRTAETVLANAVDKGELGYYGTKYSVVEKPVIPQFVAEFLIGKEDYMLYELFENEWLYEEHDQIAKWLYDNDELTNKQREIDLVMARDRGYLVEEEQKYILSINITDKASKTNYETFLNKRGIFHSMENESFNSEEFNWTEEEIKDLESGEILFEHFAVKVEELEE